MVAQSSPDSGKKAPIIKNLRRPGPSKSTATSSNLTQSVNTRKEAVPPGAKRQPPVSGTKIGTKGPLSPSPRPVSPRAPPPNKTPSEGLGRPSPPPPRKNSNPENEGSSSSSASSLSAGSDSDDDPDGGDQPGALPDGVDRLSALRNARHIPKVIEKVRGSGDRSGDVIC